MRNNGFVFVEWKAFCCCVLFLGIPKCFKILPNICWRKFRRNVLMFTFRFQMESIEILFYFHLKSNSNKLQHTHVRSNLIRDWPNTRFQISIGNLFWCSAHRNNVEKAINFRYHIDFVSTRNYVLFRIMKRDAKSIRFVENILLSFAFCFPPNRIVWKKGVEFDSRLNRKL